jgi:hypothetical protein
MKLLALLGKIFRSEYDWSQAERISNLNVTK